MAEPAIVLDDAVCVLGSFPALAGASVRIDAGHVVLLRGPNGAGKSTMLRLCAGLLGLTRGQGRVLGHDLRSASARRRLRRSVGYLGHRSVLYPELNGEENLRFWTGLAGVEDLDPRAVLDAVGLPARVADVAVAALSAGQRRRLELATLVARRPELWLLDEPHGALDPSGRDLLDDLIAQASQAGATVVVVSHESDRSQRLADVELDVRGGLIGVA